MCVSQEPAVVAIGTDPDVFERFYREHLEDVQRFVARRVSDPHAAADLTADVFLAAIEAAGRYRSASGPPRAWLFGIARNVVRMELRRRYRHTRALGRLGGRRTLQPDAMERVLERIDAAHEARALFGQLDRLSPSLRAVFELVVIDGLGVADVATVLGLDAGTVRVRLHRARTRLGVVLAQSPHPSPPREARR